MRSAILLSLMGVALLAGCQTGPGVRDREALVMAAPVCQPQRFEIYFADSEARLTEPARQAIGMTAAQLQGCSIRSVRVLGLADARGAAQANLSLSERRARTVAEALTGAGWPEPAFELNAVGAEGAVDADGVSEPLRRRTEVLVQAAPRDATGGPSPQ